MTQKSYVTKDYLIGIPEIKAVVTQLYHYYIYFSQYGHFSENGLGDVLATKGETGNDNIYFPSAIRALSAGVEEVMIYKKKDTRMDHPICRVVDSAAE